MRTTTIVTCLDCDHDHELVVVRGEYPSDDYAECPEVCEACGEPLGDESGTDDRRAERRQMGVTF